MDRKNEEKDTKYRRTNDIEAVRDALDVRSDARSLPALSWGAGVWRRRAFEGRPLLASSFLDLSHPWDRI